MLDIDSSQDYIKIMSPWQIKQLVKSLGLTQQQFADRIGVHRVTVTDWIRGANKPKGLYLKALVELAAKTKKGKVN